MPKDKGVRRHERRSFGYTAEVDFLDGSPLRPCRIVDISDGGARLYVPGAAKAPDTIKLLLTSGGAARTCQVRWRSVNECGVQFVKR